MRQREEQRKKTGECSSIYDRDLCERERRPQGQGGGRPEQGREEEEGRKAELMRYPPGIFLPGCPERGEQRAERRKGKGERLGPTRWNCCS